MARIRLLNGWRRYYARMTHSCKRHFAQKKRQFAPTPYPSLPCPTVARTLALQPPNPTLPVDSREKDTEGF